MNGFVLGLAVMLVFSSGLVINSAYAELSTNSEYLIQGSGFAVTQETIKTSEINLTIFTQQQKGSSITTLVGNGFVILGNDDFSPTNLNATMLREGKYIRINGNAESSTGNEISVKFFGRLVAESKEASVYGFTGRITTNNDTYKIIYTTQLSEQSKISVSSSEQKNDSKTIHILSGSSTQGIGNYIELAEKRQDLARTNPTETLRLRYFSDDRISIEPGTSITFVNNDTVSHRVVSGAALGSERDIGVGQICTDVDIDLPEGFSFIPKSNDAKDCDFVIDGRVDTGILLPGESKTATFDEQGFYRLIDPDYPWMRIDGYVFKNLDNLIFGQGDNLGN